MEGSQNEALFWASLMGHNAGSLKQRWGLGRNEEKRVKINRAPEGVKKPNRVGDTKNKRGKKNRRGRGPLIGGKKGG